MNQAPWVIGQKIRYHSTPKSQWNNQTLTCRFLNKLKEWSKGISLICRFNKVAVFKDWTTNRKGVHFMVEAIEREPIPQEQDA